MYHVYIEERADETSDGGKLFDKFEKLDDAASYVRTARVAYPNGAAWVEDAHGKVVPVE